MVVCPDCGKEASEGKFCKNCGARLPEIEEEPEIMEVITESEENTSEVEDAKSIEINVVDEKTADSNQGVKFCHNCGIELNGEFKFCPNCGADLLDIKEGVNQSPIHHSSKNILLAIILSVIFPGLGQIYLGLDNKGAYFLIGYVISLILCLFLIGFLLCLVIWIWALVDAIQSTNALNNGENVKDKLF